jgi:hypothetical protein
LKGESKINLEISSEKFSSEFGEKRGGPNAAVRLNSGGRLINPLSFPLEFAIFCKLDVFYPENYGSIPICQKGLLKTRVFAPNS